MFFAIILVIFITAHNTENTEAFAGAGELAAFAISQGAPFVDEAMKRLRGDIFGSGRAARSTDVVLINRTNYIFRLSGDGCDSGGWSKSLLPAFEIKARSSVVYGAESFGFLTGATKCYVKYQSTKNGASFRVETNNPYAGKVHSNGNGNKVTVRVITGRGNNNQVKFIIH